MVNVLVTGAKGQLGSEIRLLTEGKGNFFFSDIPEMDICDFSSVNSYVKEHKIGAIINCAAYTKVDNAEDEPEIAYKINAEGVKNLAAVALENDATLIHISTDYVFDGHGINRVEKSEHSSTSSPRPYRESDTCSPATVYGRTKLAGETALRESGCKSIIIRTAWLYSIFGNNFVKTMLSLAHKNGTVRVVSDQIGSPTYAKDLAKAILHTLPKLEDRPRYGEVFHYSNEGVCSWYEFTRAIMEISKLDCTIIPISSDQFPSKTERPKCSLLDKELIKVTFGVEVPQWKDSLKEMLATDF